MIDWLTESKAQFEERIFDMLWRQWSLLGVAGVGGPEEDSRIIDPEALLLFSLVVCRYEPRLFDEILDWLVVNGHFINVQRLGRIQKRYEFDCERQLGAVAELLSQKSSYRLKWAGLAKQTCQHEIEPLFYDRAGRALPCPDDNNANPEFLRHGLRRGAIHLRGYSQSFDTRSPGSLLLRMRALVGICARAEILCLLAAEKEVHPSGAARQTGYYQKTIQTTLVEMAQSGVALVRSSRKEKYYRLKSGVLDNLLKPQGRAPRWMNWPALLKAVEIVWGTLRQLEGQGLDGLLLVSELKKTLAMINDFCVEAGIDDLIVDAAVPVEDGVDHFGDVLRLLSERLGPLVLV